MRLPAICLKLLALSGLVLASTSTLAANNIVVNGSFQDNQLPSGVSWEYLNSVTGWTSTGPFEIEKGSNAGGWSTFNPDDNGNQYLELNSTELTTVSQSLQTIKGTTYDLSFDYSGRPGTPGDASSKVAVYWNGKLIDTITEPANSGWVSFNLGNLAASGSHTTLSFQSLGPTSAPSYGSYLDNVVVTAVSPVPETNTMAMFAVGLGLMGYTLRRRRQ